MKKIVLFCQLLFSMGMFSQDFLYYRDLLNKGEKNEKDAKIFLKRVESDYQKTKEPIFLGLSGVANFFLAKHSYNPINKLSYFNRGKSKIDEAIRKDPKHLELRLLRYLSQTKIPKILGYHKNLQEDEAMMRKEWRNSKDAALVKEIKKHLKIN